MTRSDTTQSSHPYEQSETVVGLIARRVRERGLRNLLRSCLVVKYTAIIAGLMTACVVFLGFFYIMQLRQILVHADSTTQDIIISKLEAKDVDRVQAIVGHVESALSEAKVSEDPSFFAKEIIRLRDVLNLERLDALDENGQILMSGSASNLPYETDLSTTLAPAERHVDLVDGTVAVFVGLARSEGSPAMIRATKHFEETATAITDIEAAFIETEKDSLRQLMTAIVLAGGLAITLGCFIAIRIARRLSQPIQQLVYAAGEVAQGRLDRDLTIEHEDEIGDLFAAFNEMNHDLIKGREAAQQASEAEIARLEAEQASQAKTSFLANMSHEIRTPMNGVLGMAQLLEMGPLTPAQKQQVDVILRSGEALITVINDILDISKLQAGQVTILDEPFDLRDTVDDVMALLGHSAREKGIELVGDMPLSVPSKLIGDKGRIRQVLINVVGNAIKFTQRGYVQIVVRNIAPVHDLENVRIAFDVTDTGVGIDSAKLDTIFNQFEQADNTTTREFGGTGLGLSISRELSTAMGGDIYLTSELGCGSTFRIEMEMRVSSDITLSEPPRQVRDPLPVLVVDDHPISQTVTREKLTRFGTKPICASDAESAWSVISRAWTQYGFTFPAVIIDYDMPGIRGVELIRQIRSTADFANTPIIVTCCVPSASISEQMTEFGVVDIIEKPFHYERLSEVINRYISTTEGRDDQVSRFSTSKTQDVSDFTHAA